MTFKEKLASIKWIIPVTLGIAAVAAIVSRIHKAIR